MRRLGSTFPCLLALFSLPSCRVVLFKRDTSQNKIWVFCPVFDLHALSNEGIKVHNLNMSISGENHREKVETTWQIITCKLKSD